MKKIIEQVKELNAQSWDLCLKIFFITEMQKIEKTEVNSKDLENTFVKLQVLETHRNKSISALTSKAIASEVF